MKVAEWADKYGNHHWRILWSSYRKLTWVVCELTTTEPGLEALTNWDIRPRVQLALTAIFVQPLQVHHFFNVTFNFGRLASSVATFFYSKFSVGNHMSVAEWADKYGIHLWRILWSSYRKLAWVGIEPTTTEPRSHSLIDLAIMPWVQLALRTIFLQPLQFRHLFSVTFRFGRFPLSITTFI